MKNHGIAPYVLGWLVLLASLAWAQSGPVGVQIAPQSSFLSVGNTQQFTATRTVNHWFTSDPTTATVDTTGLVTGLQAGVVTITGVSGPYRNSAILAVVALPLATGLSAGVPAIAAGQSTTLTGFFSGGAGVITNDQDNLALQVTSSIPVSISPKTNTFYTLTVTNQAGSFTNKAAGITVVAAPSISSFAPAAGLVTNGNSATLTAVFSGGSGVINPGGISVSTSPASVPVSPAANSSTVYVLTVTGANGSTATANTAVQAVAAPQFLGGPFSGSPSIISTGTFPIVTLNIPTFSPGATGVITNNVNSNVLNATPAQGATLVVAGVNTTTTFILTETNQAGTSISAPFTVTAVPLPTATALMPSATTVTSGNSVLLIPIFSNGTGVISNNVNANILNVGTGAAVSSGLLSASSYSFFLAVTNAAGATVTVAAPVITVVPAPSISSFTVSPSTIISGNPTTLTATFANGTGIVSNSADSSTIVVTSGVGVPVSPTQDIIYTLTVTNAAGTSKSANTFVDVN